MRVTICHGDAFQCVGRNGSKRSYSQLLASISSGKQEARSFAKEEGGQIE